MQITEDDYIAGAGARLPRRRRLFLALLLGLMAAFGPLCTDTYLPSLPAMAADLSISTATTQLTITACLLGMALGQLFVGPLSDSTGRRKPLFVALVFFYAGFGLLRRSQNWQQLYCPALCPRTGRGGRHCAGPCHGL